MPLSTSHAALPTSPLLAGSIHGPIGACLKRRAPQSTGFESYPCLVKTATGCMNMFSFPAHCIAVAFMRSCTPFFTVTSPPWNLGHRNESIFLILADFEPG